MTCTRESPATAPRYVPLLGIGRGGMGRIDVALAVGIPGAEQLVVLKRLLEAELHDEVERASLMREAALSSRLEHPSIVTTLGLDLLDGELVLVLEYLEGASLAALVRSCKALDEPFPRRIALRVVRDVLAGLRHAHELRDYDMTPLDIVHRDVSPSNVLLTIDGASKVLDFGIAKASRSYENTPPGLIKGKLGYMAPEQILGWPTDCRADIYAVGVMLWEALTQQRFSTSESIQDCLSVRLREEKPAIRDVAPEVPRALEQIVQRCLARSPERRWPSAAALWTALEEYVAAHHEDASRDEVAAFVRRHYGGLLGERRRTLHERIARVTATPPISGVHPRSWSVPAVAMSCAPPASSDGPTLAVPRPRASKLLPYAAGLICAVGSWCFSSLGPPPAAPALARAPRDVGVEAAALGESRPRAKADDASSAEPAPAPAAPRSSGFAAIDAYPASSVTIDGTYRGKTPLAAVPLPAGPHVVVLENEAHARHVLSVTVREGETVTESWRWQ